jgi:hypothetical protein
MIQKKARHPLRGNAGPEGLADVSTYLTPEGIHGKIRCHESIVTDVTIRAVERRLVTFLINGTSNNC